MDQSLNVRPETIKILEENISSSLFVNHSSILGFFVFCFLDLSPMAKETEAKINNTKLSLEAFAQQRKPLTKLKNSSIEWEKTFANDMTYKASLVAHWKRIYLPM